jgi:hypothetical protein
LKEPGGFFRGRELSGLLILSGLMVAGWVGAWYWYTHRAEKDSAPPRRVAVASDALPPRDDSAELQGITDRAPLNPRENPGYLLLLNRVRSTPPEKLAAEGRTDVVFSQLLESPDRYRGLPIHLEGTALRVLRQPATGSKLFPKGEFFEVYAITPDSQNFPYILVIENAPPELPVGDNVRVHFAFDGYFFKLMAYAAGDTNRFAPLLVGRIRWLDLPRTKPPAPPAGGLFSGANAWMWAGLAALFIYMIFRWTYYLRRAFSASPRRRIPTTAVTEEIEPEALSEWLDEQAQADDYGGYRDDDRD